MKFAVSKCPTIPPHATSAFLERVGFACARSPRNAILHNTARRFFVARHFFVACTTLPCWPTANGNLQAFSFFSSLSLVRASATTRQVEACPPGGTPLRRKLSSRFVDAMNEFVSSSGDEMAFFKGRQWLPRGVRYPGEDEESDAREGDVENNGGGEGDGTGSAPSAGTAAKATATAAESTEEALAAAVDEVELAYHESRLRGAVQAALVLLQKNAEAEAAAAAAAGSSSSRSNAKGTTAAAESAAAAQSAVLAAAAVLQSPSAESGDVVGAVDNLCSLAENDGDAVSAAAKDALDALIGFAGSGDGPGKLVLGARALYLLSTP